MAQAIARILGAFIGFALCVVLAVYEALRGNIGAMVLYLVAAAWIVKERLLIERIND